MSFEPQPTLAWQFENSNVDSIQNLGPTFSTVTSGLTIAPSYVAGKYGQAIQFNNTDVAGAANSYVNYTLSSNISSNSCSVACWINPYQFSATRNQSIINIFGDAQATVYFLVINQNTSNVSTYSTNGGVFSTTNSIPLNAWSHCALTFNNGTVVLYLNGFAQGSGTITVPYDGNRIYVGGAYNNINGFMGAVDDLRVYRQALTGAQVLALYLKQGTPVPTDGPKLAWQFENSNVESIQGIVPFSQVSPGPAQLQGLAALATNARVIDTALFLPRFAGSYIDLGTSSPVNVDVSTSNLFVEAWVYNVYNTTSPIISAGTGTANNWSLSITGNGVIKLYANCFPGAPISGFFGAATPGGWYHIAFSWALGPTSNTLTGFINGNRNYQDATFTRGIRYTPGIQTIIGDPSSGFNVYVRDVRVVRGGIVPTNSFTPVPMQLEQFSYTLPSYVSGTDGSVVFTLLSQFVTYPPGKFNKCLRLNNGTSGLNSRIEYSSLASTLNNFSIAAWVYPYSVNTARTNTFFEMKPLAVTGTQFQVSAATSGKSTVAVSTNGGSLTELNSVANLTLGKWTHHCLTFSNVGATTVGNVFASYYINGTLQASSNATTQASGLLSNLVMGSTTNASADSGLDDFRVYDRTLTSTEVNTVYLSFGDPAGPKTYASGTSSNISIDGDGFTTHTFTTPGTFTCLRPGVADVLVVAGGGGGGGTNALSGRRGGGGGAGGVIYSPNFNIRAGVYTITVGNGGSGTNTNTSGSNGFPSQFMELFAIGGGGGGADGVNGRFGGSGGGAGRVSYSAIGGVYGQGNSSSGTGNNGAGGGGGARGAGTAGLEGYGGKGGEGLVFSGNIYGGGGAGAGSAAIVIAGGSGGGGSSFTTTGTPGTANTGGGGGGAGSSLADPAGTGGNGGSGIVIIKMFNQVSTAGYETVYTGETTIGNFQGYSQTANVQVFAGSTSQGSAPYVWVKPSRGTFARIECIGGGGNGASAVASGTYTILLFMQTNGNLANGHTCSNEQMLDLGITYSGTIPVHTITTSASPLFVTIATTGSNIFLVNLDPKPAGTVLNTIQGSSGTINGQYARGGGGGGGGYAFATLPLEDLPATANVSVGGLQTASVFGPLTSQYLPLGNVTGPAGTFAFNKAAGSAGPSPIAPQQGIFVGGAGSPWSATSIGLASYAGYGAGGGGNGIVPGAPSAFAGKGGDGSPQAQGTYAQNGEYPGGGGGGALSAQALAATPGSGAGAGAGAAGQVRIIVY